MRFLTLIFLGVIWTFNTTHSISDTFNPNRTAPNPVAANLKMLSGYPYFPHIMASSMIACSVAYYWYNGNLIKDDDVSNYDPGEPHYTMPGMVGACPPELAPIIERLRNDNAIIGMGISIVKNEGFDTVLLFEGPTGTGKTTLARTIATSTNSHFVEIYGADVPNSFIGGSKDVINEKIATAIAEGKAYRKRVIIFIDEIDAFSCNENSGARTEYDAAYKALWRHIDNNKDNLGVLFIFATNHLNRIPVELRNRVDTCIHMKNPNALQRKELLNHFSLKYIKKQLSEYCSGDAIETLIKETKNFSIRNIANLCKHAYQNASYKNESIGNSHLMKELEKTKADVALQQALSKDEQEKKEISAMNRENLMWARMNGIWTTLNIISTISFITL